MPTPQQKTARKNIAEVGLREELAKRKGGFKELDDVKEFLQVFAVESELSKDYFQILDDKDYADMYIKAMNTISLSVNAGSRPSTGATTPPESSASSPEDYHEPRRLSYEDPDECFDVKFQHPSKNLLEMVTANRCKEGDSFISDRILARDNLSIHLDADNAIRLTWKTFSEGSVKTYRTRFRKIPDADIANDIAIGQNAYSDDEVDHNVSEPMNQLSLGNDGNQVQMPALMVQNAAAFFCNLQEHWDQKGSARKRQSQGVSDIVDPDFSSKRPRMDGPSG